MSHIFLGVYLTTEITDYPLFNTGQKVIWLVVVWVLPIIGIIVASRKIGLKWSLGKPGEGGSSYGGDGGD